MRKRMLSAAMAGMMVVSMTACGGSKQAETTAAATEAETSAEETTAAETTAEAADEAGSGRKKLSKKLQAKPANFWIVFSKKGTGNLTYFPL